jgi:hypothetical protein
MSRLEESMAPTALMFDQEIWSQYEEQYQAEVELQPPPKPKRQRKRLQTGVELTFPKERGIFRGKRGGRRLQIGQGLSIAVDNIAIGKGCDNFIGL